jgi:hypothetical protein
MLLQPDSREIKSLIMASDLPEDGLRPSQNNSEASVFPNDDGNGLSQGAILPQGLPTLAPWSNLSWGLFLPLVFASNVVLATLAWIIDERCPPNTNPSRLSIGWGLQE